MLAVIIQQLVLFVITQQLVLVVIARQLVLVFTIQQLMSVLIIQQLIIVKQLFVIDAPVLNLFIQQLILFFNSCTPLHPPVPWRDRF